MGPELTGNLRSTRFLIFDQYARIVAEHQNEFNQILPQAGWHEQSPNELFESVLECMLRAVKKFEEMGWSKDSIKGIGESLPSLPVLYWLIRLRHH